MSKLVLHANIELQPNARRETLDEIEHLVIPAIAIREGVLNNIFYPSDELAEFVEAWNGVPVPVNHPMKGDSPVTANSTVVEATTNIGRFYNVSFKDNAVKGEIWINIAKAEKLGFIDIVNSLEAGEQMEVSTGLLAFTREEEGTFNGKQYANVIDTIRPDHLALLPDELGACSIEDGCGAMRVNCKGDKCTCGTKKKDNGKGFLNKLRKWFGVNAGASFNEKDDAVRNALREAYGKDSYPYIVNLYDGYVIFEQGPSLYRQSYTLDSNTKATLQGEKLPVKVKVDYVPVTNNKDKDMKPENRTALVNALALAMVVNAEAVTPEVTSNLAALPDTVLSGMAGQYKLNEDGTAKADVVPVVPTVQPVTANTDTALTGDERTMLNELKQERETRLANKRKLVTEAHPSVTDVIANTMTEPALDALLVNAAQPVGNYAGASAAPVTNKEGEVYKSPSIFLQTNKKGDK